MNENALKPRTVILIILAAAGLFAAGLGYGYEGPQDDGGFGGNPPFHGASHANF